MVAPGEAAPPPAPQPSRRPVGLYAALLAVALTVGWLFGYAATAQQLARHYVRALGPMSLPFKAQTLTLQRAALATRGVLPIYGTSELYCCGQPYNAGTFYRTAPTGFSVFNVGYPVTEDLFWAQTFGALGSALRGKRIVVSDSPWFLGAQGIPAPAYAHTFSPEIATVFTFDAPVPYALRAAVARRMLDFPTTLQALPLDRVALRNLARGGLAGRAAYLLMDPAGRLLAWTAQLQDAWRTVQTIDHFAHPAAAARRALHQAQVGREPWWRWVLHLPLPASQLQRKLVRTPAPLQSQVPTLPRAVDWTATLRQATAQAKRASPTNPFGVLTVQWRHCNDISPVYGPWCTRALALYRSGRSNHFGNVLPLPPGWVHGVVVCRCWTDLNLEFMTLRAVRARPFAWLQPLQGALADYTPWSARARRVVYDRYLAIARADGIPATTFQTHDTDPMFMDSFGHLSQRGWVYADRLLTLFWHGQLGLIRQRLARGGSVGGLFPPALNCPKPAWCRGVADVQPIPGSLAQLPTGMPRLRG